MDKIPYNFWRFVKSLVTDKDWEWDAAKFFGLAIIVCGLVGFFLGKPSFEVLLVIGGTMITTGKWSEERSGKGIQ